jgi:pimeloyl-ACP methyl ester carboxylesterase
LEGLIKEKKVKEIVFTGHSLGGALAQIAALDLASQFAIGQVVSLGSACIGGPGMRDRFAQCRVADGEGVLHERTRVFAYTKDIMPRIPPISWFCHVGRRFCLPEAGRPIEGSEASLWAGLIALFRRSISGLAFFVLDLATIIRDSSRGRRKRSQINSLHLTKRDAKPELQGDLVVASSHDFDLRGAAEDKVTFGDLFRYAKQIWQCVPRKDHLIHHAIVAATVIALLSPIVLLVTIYGYYVMMIWKGLFSGHGVGNYRYVLRQYYASVRPQPAAVASTAKSMEELVLLAGNVRWYQRWLAGETSRMVSDRQLIYVADGQPRHLFVTKFAEYHRWRRERAVPNLSREARDKIDARARSNGLNTDQVKAIWGDGKSLFVERLLNDELCMLPQPYSGSYAEAIGRLGLVLGPGYWSLVTPMSGSPAAGSA